MPAICSTKTEINSHTWFSWNWRFETFLFCYPTRKLREATLLDTGGIIFWVTTRFPRNFFFWRKASRRGRRKWRHYSGLFKVFCSPRGIAWNKFHAFRNRKSDSVETFWKIPFIFIIFFFFSSLPCSQSWPVNPAVHTQRYRLLVKPDWQMALFLQGALPQAFLKVTQRS